MKAKQIARLMAIVLTLITMVSCLAVILTIPGYAGSYMAFDGSALNSKMTGTYKLNKSLSGTELTLTATDNDPYFQISGVSDTVLRTYPYVVIRYKSDHLGTFEIFSGHPNTDSCRVSMPVVPTNGQWGVLFYDFSVVDTNKKSWFRLEPMTVNGEKITIGEIVLFTDKADADAYGYVYANAGARSGATGGGVVFTHNDFDYWGNSNGRSGENQTSSIDIARKNNTRYKDGGYYTRITASGSDPYVWFSNNTTFKNAANTYTYLSIRYRASGGSNIRAYTNTNSGSVKSAAANITGDQTWRWATITLNKDSSTFRLDYIDAGASSGLWIDIAEMYFHNGTNDIYNLDVGNSSDRNGNNDGRKLDVRMYFLHRDGYSYFEHTSSVSKISGGSLNGYYRQNQTSNFLYALNTRTVVGRTFYYVAGTHSSHTNNSGTVTVQATCTTAGTTRYNCTACNDVTGTNTSLPAALGHANGAAATCTTAQTCTRCSVTLQAALGHAEVADAAKDATCTETGLTAGTHCSRCSVVLQAQNVVDALGHAEVTDAAVAPDCTNTGLTEGCHCSRCEVVLTAQNVIDALGHNEIDDAAVEPDCTHTGLTAGKHCDRCNEITLPQVSVDALGHNKENVTTEAATCTGIGHTYYHCSRCAELQETVEIEALGHNITETPKVDPTYTTVGYTAGQSCSRCDEVNTVGQEIPKLNPLLTYNVALNEKFAVNMMYVAFDGATITVVDETGTAYAFTATNTGKTHTDGLPIWSIRIANISAQDIGHTFTVTEGLSEYSSSVSVKGYCMQVDNLYAGKTEEDLTNYYMSEAGGSYTESVAQALAKKTLLAHDTTKKITVYGQAAENYFNQQDADHTGLQGQIADYTPTGVYQTVSNTGLVQFTGANVRFGDQVELLLRMKNYNGEKMYVKMGDGEFVEVPESEISDRLSKDGEYTIFSLVVRPDEFSTAITVRAGSVEEDFIDYFAGSSKVTYSVDKYISNTQAKYEQGKTTLAMLNLVNALGNYGKSAVAYANG